MKHLKVGVKAPDIDALDELGNQITLSQFKGKKLILFFYPKDSTPTCTVEACNLRDNYSDLLNKGFNVVGVSADTEKKHQNFINKHKLPFPLIADVDKKVINDYGVWGPKKFMGRSYDGIHRKTFLFDESGFLVDVIEKPKTKFHADEIINAYLKSTSS